MGQGYKIMKIVACTAILLYLLLFHAGCTVPPQMIQLQPETPEVQITAGTFLVLALPGNPSTGFQWHVSVTPELLQTVSESYTPRNTDSRIAGAGGTANYVFSAIQSGTCTITARYFRPWEGYIPARGREHCWRVTVHPAEAE